MTLDVQFEEQRLELNAQFEENCLSVDVELKDAVMVPIYVPSGEWPLYTGSCVVTPKTEVQTLPTAKTSMRNDVTVKAIPFYEVSNTSGGSTVFIGTEVI